MADQELIEMLAGVIQANTEAMKSVKEAMDSAKTSNDNLAESVAGLRRTIQGAQKKINSELQPAIDRSKAAADTLAREAGAVVASRRKPS